MMFFLLFCVVDGVLILIAGGAILKQSVKERLLQKGSTMTSLRRFTCIDLLVFNNVNLDYYTETVGGLLGCYD